MDFGREILESGCNVYARLKRGAEERKEHLLPDREGGYVGRGNRGKTCGGEPKVGSSLVEERDQMVEVSCGREGRERSRSRVSRGATLVGGHVCV